MAAIYQSVVETVEKILGGLVRPSSTEPPYARKWVPDYTRIVGELIAKVFIGIWAAIKGIAGLRWYHVLFPPLAVYYFASLWLAGFVGIPPLVQRDSPAPWFDRYVGLTAYPNAGNPLSKKTGMWWIPKSSLTWAFTHGLMVRGLTSLQMFTMVLLFFPQLMLASFWRCCQFRFNFGAWKPNKANNGQSYLAIINTSLGAYWDNDASAFVYHDVVIISTNSVDQTKFSKITIFCDHDEKVVLKMVIDAAADPVKRIKASTIVLEGEKDAEEISIFITQIGALQTHPQVHWWANGVQEVQQWPLRETSNKWTQFLNYLSCFQSLFFYHGDFINDTLLLAENLSGGMPMHNVMPEKLIQNSVMHQMTYEARNLLREHFKKAGTPISESELNCLMCATIFHAADHHYLNKYACRNGLSDILQNDFRTMRLCIVGGYRWIGTRFLCKQYPEDPVCTILYKTALKHDPEFANGLLTMGIAI